MSQIQEPRAIAFLGMLAWSEGTSSGGRDPYRVTYGYRHEIQDLSDHPSATGEWIGLRLPDQYCHRAGLRPGCKSTAAGAYQITLPTWRDRNLRKLYDPTSFRPSEQDGFCWHALIRSCRAQQAVLEGDISGAIRLCSNRWASLPSSSAGQPKHSLSSLLHRYDELLGELI